MQEFSTKQPKAFYTRKVSINTAIRILNQNDIRVNEHQAKEILDFLYLIAKTYNLHEDNQRFDSRP
ncbi:hypothetical protein HDF24_20435 [Mucilaginibacter sp. X4EP1]|jgi:hypothetical protein|uniref:hypothetical protein n=1 Tax=Mucilaginibacter sp. X4EP1 TaxID=2723092 RepID=UPI002168415C|nr:hypothetical protein [Mucilaginibacter sp. X4EP1]MCS3812653.1 hypothetical protein [Mucilaginibacter sp. X4EP1]